MSALFEPIRLRTLTVPNRVWMSPMCQYSAPETGADTGVAGDWHLAHQAARAVGGAGLIVTEATAVSPEGRISPADLGLWNDRQQQGLARIVAFLNEYGAVPGIQLAHAGRKASAEVPWRGGRAIDPRDPRGWRPLAPSPIPFHDGDPTPAELTTDQIGRVVEDFAAAARRALDAGFKVVEIHGAHGYLLNEFTSPYTNRREDEYGGAFENRIRFALEVVDAVRAVWPDELPVFYRVSATDWLTENPEDDRDGWTLADTVRFGKELLAHGVDLLDVSSGGIAPGAKITAGPGYQVPFAARVKEETDLLVGAVGKITEPRQAEEIIASGQADAVLLGRELLREPYWPHRATRELDADAAWPRQYGYAV